MTCACGEDSPMDRSFSSICPTSAKFTTLRAAMACATTSFMRVSVREAGSAATVTAVESSIELFVVVLNDGVVDSNFVCLLSR